MEDYAPEVVFRMEAILGETQRDEVRESLPKMTRVMIESQDDGRIPCCEVPAGRCAVRVFGTAKVRPNDIFDLLHASAGIPSSEAYFCDGPMAHLVRSKELKLDQQFEVWVHSKPEDLLNYLREISEHV